jgi:hypothetical protein
MRVDTVLGLLGVALFIVCTISLAAAVTFAVVKISPSPQKKEAKAAAEAE